MVVRKHFRAWAAACGAVLILSSTTARCGAEEPLNRENLVEPIYRVSKISPADKQLDAIDQHPLDPVLHMAGEIHANVLQNVRDYTCTLVKRENVGGTLLEHEFMHCKIRNEQVVDGRVVVPFSVYLKFLAPAAMKGREVIFVRGQNDDRLVAHEGGFKGRLIPTVNLVPDNMLAMRGNRYPITEIGLETLCRRLIEKGQRDRQLGDCLVEVRETAMVDDRPCTCVEVTHPTRQPQLDFHKALVFMDKELKVPIRYEAYDWSSDGNGPGELIEEYTYRKLKINVGLTDDDFNPDNPRYGFR